MVMIKSEKVLVAFGKSTRFAWVDTGADLQDPQCAAFGTDLVAERAPSSRCARAISFTCLRGKYTGAQIRLHHVKPFFGSGTDWRP